MTVSHICWLKVFFLTAHINLQCFDSVHKISRINIFFHVNMLKVFLSFNNELSHRKKYILILFFKTI